eukprot:TRINITY_DN880_c0_g1_i6.p4 TRINITY_DN880_c0_g1~~TRINITY_DN880_c0_g1_i6.p4  ORF type:complete len:124 (-),score=4.12 TRINITY_DN880_c0_g1_i6:360-680(-)
MIQTQIISIYGTAKEATICLWLLCERPQRFHEGTKPLPLHERSRKGADLPRLILKQLLETKWKEMDEDQKGHYLKLAEQEKIRYKEEKTKYMASIKEQCISPCNQQ